MRKIEKIKSNAVEVFENDEQFWTTSLDVAEKFGKRHDNVLQSIRKLECPEDFYLLNFKEITREVQGGEGRYYILSRDAFSLLAMGFSGKEAMQWKIKYIEAFNQLEQTVKKLLRQKRRQFTLEWKQLREDSKASRRTATDVYQEFVDYAIEQGTHNGPHWYSLLTERVYDAVIPGGHVEIQRRKKELKQKNGRDTLTPDEFLKLIIMEATFVKKVISETLSSGIFYKEAYKIIKEKLSQYGEMINKKLLLHSDN